jgi:hypothetical protein
MRITKDTELEIVIEQTKRKRAFWIVFGVLFGGIPALIGLAMLIGEEDIKGIVWILGGLVILLSCIYSALSFKQMIFDDSSGHMTWKRGSRGFPMRDRSFSKAEVQSIHIQQSELHYQYGSLLSWQLSLIYGIKQYATVKRGGWFKSGVGLLSVSATFWLLFISKIIEDSSTIAGLILVSAIPIGIGIFGIIFGIRRQKITIQRGREIKLHTDDKQGNVTNLAKKISAFTGV